MAKRVKYQTITADPPWAFGDALAGSSRGAIKNYQTLSIDEICNFPLPRLTDDCRLFLWRVAAMQEEALAVIKAWGFILKSEVIWKKLTKHGKRHFGMGHQVRMEHETCLIAIRGWPKVLSHSVRSIFEAPYTRHSAKPEMFYRDIVEQLSPGPYVELFGRHQRTGWTVLGDQAWPKA